LVIDLVNLSERSENSFMMSVVAVLQGFFLQLEGGGGGGGRVVGDGGRDVHISKDGLVASRN
jgi:hypothetical protein